jgi:hypothetical protein
MCLEGVRPNNWRSPHRIVEPGDEGDMRLAVRQTPTQKKRDLELPSCTGMQKEFKTKRLNWKGSCITTTSTYWYAAYKKQIFKMGSPLKSEDMVFRNARQDRKKGGVMALIRSNINAGETKRRMGEAEYTSIQTMITTATCTLDLVNYYCPNDKSLHLAP